MSALASKKVMSKAADLQVAEKVLLTPTQCLSGAKARITFKHLRHN
jgi:hypothetical protein